MMETTELLQERGKTHGDFSLHAEVTQDLKLITHGHLMRQTKELSAVAQESLDMIFHKIGRIIAGDADFADHWEDIAGYAKLVAQRCTK